MSESVQLFIQFEIYGDISEELDNRWSSVVNTSSDGTMQDSGNAGLWMNIASDLGSDWELDTRERRVRLINARLSIKIVQCAPHHIPFPIDRDASILWFRVGGIDGPHMTITTTLRDELRRVRAFITKGLLDTGFGGVDAVTLEIY